MAVKPAPAPKSGRIGRYEVGASIAAGGMATVYLARMSGPSGFEKLVALKRVHPHLANEPAFVEMFLDEAKIASGIQHPNVCQVFDFGHEGDDYFLAMEFLVGETLSKVQRAIAHSDFLHHPRRPFVLTRLVVDACEGLHAAHELRRRDGSLMNVVHRDISPQNLFCTFAGNTKILDFGIASASDRLHQTSAGTVKGKFAYMAPEQANGQAVDRRSDVWALGVVLWELLAFRRLFRRETPGQSLAALLHDEIMPPSQVSQLAPPELDDIVLKALKRDPDERYPTSRELGRDLLRAIGRLGDPVDRAEVEEWMVGLFPDGKRRHELMLENARWGEQEATELSEPSVSDVISRGSWSGLKQDLVGGDDVLLIDDGDDLKTTASETPPPMPRPAALPQIVPLAPPGQTGPHMPVTASTVTPAAVAMPPAQASNWPKLIGLAVLFLLLSFGTGFAGLFLFGPDAPEDTAGAATPPEAPTQIGATGTVTPTPETPEQPTQPEPPVEPDPDTPDVEEPPTDEGTQTATDQPEDPPPSTRRRRRRRRGGGGQEQPNNPAVGPGTVIVSTPGGWANVYDRNGRFLGETPLTLQLPAGQHRLSLRPYGQPPPQNVTVNVTSGQTSRVSRRL